MTLSRLLQKVKDQAKLVSMYNTQNVIVYLATLKYVCISSCM